MARSTNSRKVSASHSNWWQLRLPPPIAISVIFVSLISGALFLFAWYRDDFGSVSRLKLSGDRVPTPGPSPTIQQASEIHGQAQQLYAEGKYTLAIPLVEQALKLRTDAVGEDETTAAYWNDLGILHDETGDLVNARIATERSLQILLKLNVSSSWQLAATHSSLGLTLLNLGDRNAAQLHLEQALKLKSQIYGPESREVLISRLNLQSVAKNRTDFLRETAVLSERILGPKDQITIQTQSQLADTLGDQGQYAEAISMMHTCLDNAKDAEGTLPAWSDTLLSNLADWHRAIGEFDEAERQFQLAWTLMQSNRGVFHEDSLKTARGIGFLHFQRQKLEEAGREFEMLWERLQTVARQVLPGLSEAEAVEFVKKGHINIARDVLLSLSQLSESSADPTQAYRYVADAKAMVLQVLMNRRRLTSSDPAIVKLGNDLQNLRSRISKLTLGGLETTIEQDKLSELTLMKERLERELINIGQPHLHASQSLDDRRQSFAELIPSDCVIVDFCYRNSYRPSGEGKFDVEECLDAFVIAPPKNAHFAKYSWVQLGKAAPIRQLIQTVYDDIKQPKADSFGNAVRNREMLKASIWNSIRERCPDATRIVVIPDGDISLVPWETLPGENGKSYLIETLQFIRLGHVSQLNQKPASAPLIDGRLLLCGGIDYGSGDDKVRISASWSALPGTASEIAAIAEMTPQNIDVQILTGQEADEKRITEAITHSRMIHLATHGFMSQQDDSITDSESSSQHDSAMSNFRTVDRNPLSRVGIVCAGANKDSARETIDGLLTAEEIVDLDLNKTELVVLSACETFRGHTLEGEGVFGLQRAFHLAGARSVIASLWKVEDSATQALMSDFYFHLWDRGLPPGQALRAAQLRMLRDYNPRTGHFRGLNRKLKPTFVPHEPETTIDATRTQIEPFYWAAFVMSGFDP